MPVRQLFSEVADVHRGGHPKTSEKRRRLESSTLPIDMMLFLCIDLIEACVSPGFDRTACHPIFNVRDGWARVGSVVFVSWY